MISFRCRRARYTSALNTIITRDARIILSELRMCTYTRASSEKDKITIYRLIISNDSLRERTLNTIRYRRYTCAALISNTTRVIKNVITNNIIILLYLPVWYFFFLWNADGPPKMSVLYTCSVQTDGKVKIITLVLREKKIIIIIIIIIITIAAAGATGELNSRNARVQSVCNKQL